MTHLGTVVVHGQHAEHVKGVSTLHKLSHGVGLKRLRTLDRDLITRRTRQALHTNNTVLKSKPHVRHLETIQTAPTQAQRTVMKNMSGLHFNRQSEGVLHELCS